MENSRQRRSSASNRLGGRIALTMANDLLFNGEDNVIIDEEYAAATGRSDLSEADGNKDDDDVVESGIDGVIKPDQSTGTSTTPEDVHTKKTTSDAINESTQDGPKMNVVLLFPDDWRHNSIGAENPIIQTPFLDTLAQEGIRFRQNAVTTSICWQSRATLFSGQWASRHQSYKLKCPHFAKGKHWNHTWPALLQRNAGYHVGHVGKWQYHSNNDNRFDWSSYFEGKHWFRKQGKDIAAEDHARNETIRFLNERPKDKPFAVTVAFYPPKPVSNSNVPGGQWTPKNESRAIYNNMTIPEPFNHSKAFKLLPEFLQRDRSAAAARWRFRYSTPFHYQEAMKNIYALITQVDQACKEIVDELKKQGVYNNTMIIFTTDNGMFHGAHGLAGKWYPYQESIRVPLIVYDPRMPKEKRGFVDDAFTLNVDLAETILGAAGLMPDELMQGRDISDLYLPKVENGKPVLVRKPWRDEFFYEFTFMDENYIPSSNALVRKKWKYIDWYAKNHEQLFDLENDPLELNDVKDDPANAEIVKDMRKRMIELRDDLKEPELECDKHGDYSAHAPDLDAIKTLTDSKNETDTR
eukprot:scaffold5222_cov282-Chaetoceros_neogracile.AAC.16